MYERDNNLSLNSSSLVCMLFETENDELKNSLMVNFIVITENKIVSALLSCEPEPLLAINLQQTNSTLSSSSSTQYKTICILSDLVDRELVATIGWAKQIPGFTDLILNDQMRLLQTTWAEILSLSLAFRFDHYFNKVKLLINEN